MDEPRRREQRNDPAWTEERMREREALRQRHDAPPEHERGSADESGEIVHEARERVGEFTRETGHELRRVVDSRKGQAADTMERVARAMRRTADSLEEEEAEGLADYPERVADRVDRVSQYIRQHDLGDMIADTEDFARRRPELFFGGLALAGMAAGRFLRSSSPSRSRSRERPGPTRPHRPYDLERSDELTGGGP